MTNPWYPRVPSSVAIFSSVTFASSSAKTSSSAVRAPRMKVSTSPLAARVNNGVTPIPPPMARTFPVGKKPFPKGPLMPILSPSLRVKRAEVASPTFITVMAFAAEKAMGISSTPGTQTIQNWPGRMLKSSSKTKVLMVGVSSIILVMVTTAGMCSSVMSTPHDFFGRYSICIIKILGDIREDVNVVVDCAANLNS